jgi:hypothetical protein
MTRYAPLWQQANSYPASLDRQMLAALFATPGRTVWPGGAVSAVSGTMGVSISPGAASVQMQSGQGVEVCSWDAAETVTLAAAPSSNSRIDLVVLQVQDNTLDASGQNAFVFTSVTGVAGASPVAPTVPVNALALAQVTVASGIANLNSAPITDLRVPPNNQNLWARITQSVTPNPGAGTWTTMNLGNTDFASPGFLNVAGHLQLPIAGRYDLEGTLGTANGTSNGTLTGMFMVGLQWTNPPAGWPGPVGQPVGMKAMAAGYSAASYPNLVVTAKRLQLAAAAAIQLIVWVQVACYIDSGNGAALPCTLAARYVGP